MLVHICIAAVVMGGQSAGEPLIHEATLPVAVEKAWSLFSTTEGVKKWVAPRAECDFRVGGSWRASYDESSNLRDEKTIINQILSYDPYRMISIRCVQTPAGFPWPEEFKSCWSVIYFDKVDGGTKVTIKGYGYPDTENGRKLREFFRTGNDQVVAALVKAAEELP